MKLTTISLVLATALLATTAGASAQSRLGQAADSLEDSLKGLNREFDQRGDRFHDAASPLFRALSKARDVSDRLGKEASQNKPKWQLQDNYQDLRGRMTELARELGRLSLTRDENRAASAVWYNDRLVASAWERYGSGGGGGTIIYPPRPPVVGGGGFTEAERARTYATRYLTAKYRVSARDLNLGRTTDLGRIIRVRVGVKNIGVRLVDVDPRNGAIIAERRE